MQVTVYKEMQKRNSTDSLSFVKTSYTIMPKFLDRQAWANSIDPGQTAPAPTLITYSMVKIKF